MGGGHLLHVYNSSHAYRMKRLTAYIPMSVKRYSEGKKKLHHNKEHSQEEIRAPSTAEEFRRLAEEKTRQGFVSSHTSEKAQDGFEVAANSDSDAKSVKERLDKPPGVGNLHNVGEERHPLEKK